MSKFVWVILTVISRLFRHGCRGTRRICLIGGSGRHGGTRREDERRNRAGGAGRRNDRWDRVGVCPHVYFFLVLFFSICMYTNELTSWPHQSPSLCLHLLEIFYDVFVLE
jgi:hypothetical protein